MANKNEFPDLPTVPAIAGVRIAGVAAGLKDNGKHALFVAETARSARNIGRSIDDSMLVRVGIAGAEPRAGRTVMAVGKAGEKAARDRLAIAIGDVAIAEGGETVSGFDADTVARHLKSDQVQISVDIGIGRGKARVWAAI